MHRFALSLLSAAALAGCVAPPEDDDDVAIARSVARAPLWGALGRAKNVILFVGDGMGLSTVAATRVYAVGVDGRLVMDQLPFSGLSRTADADHITADSASTMTAMMTGERTSSGVIGLDATTELADFNHDGDGARLPTLLERAKQRGLRVGVVTTARVTHATPAATYAHINDRDAESDIALQLLPGMNPALGAGLDLLLGGGRQFFVPADVVDEEGGAGSRTDGRDLRAELQDAGYDYVWNRDQLADVTSDDLPVLGLFERSHMEYEHDRATDVGGEPSLSELASKSVELLEDATRYQWHGYVLVVEGGRIDHAHHAGNAFRALTETEELDRAIGEVIARVDLSETLVLVTADHSHTFTMGGYPLRPAHELAYPLPDAPAELDDDTPPLGVVWDVDATGHVAKSLDKNGVPYTVLGYHNGPGHRGVPRTDPGPATFDPAYLQEAAVPLESETHAGEDVPVYAIGPGSWHVRGTFDNTHLHTIMAAALGL